MSSEMRGCPFCGNQPRSGWQGTGVPGMDDCGYWGIDCCNAFAHADTEAEALAQWNRRALLARTESGPSLLCQSDACAHKGTAHNFCTPRTEAGADGAVGYVSADGNAVWLTEGSFSLKPAAGTNLFAHPQARFQETE